MLDTALFVTLLVVGVLIALQGIWVRRRPERAQPVFLERPLLDVLDLEDPREMARVLGRLRVVYGLFFILLGLWGLLF